jgi:hypothetical protein
VQAWTHAIELVVQVQAWRRLVCRLAVLCSSREFVTSNDKPRIVAYRYDIEASINVSQRHAQAVAQFKP